MLLNPRSRFRSVSLLSLLAVPILLLIPTQQASAQFNFPNRPFAVGGIYIDSKGMLKETLSLAPDERLKLLRAEAADPPGSAELAAGSGLRKVSLKRLESAVRKLHAGKQALPADIRYLAGLREVRYIFFYPETGDVVLAGPAEGWKQAPSGEVVGAESNRPVLHLDDLIVALRYAFSNNRPAPFIGCSIDPTLEGFKKYAAYMNKLGGRMDRSRLPQFFDGMAKAMGPQSIRLFGIPPSSRFALKMVAADYRLKRIAMGHDPSPVREVKSYLDLAAKRSGGSGRQPQHRWWFVGNYDAVFHTPDHLGFELSGQGVKVSTAPSTASPLKAAKGKVSKIPKATPAARQFATLFTKHFPAIAQQIPVFAELQNVISLALAAELIAQNGREKNAESQPWRPAHFLDAKACPIQQAIVPTQVPSLVNARRLRRGWLISVSGGVEINPATLAGRQFRKESPNRTLAETRTKSHRVDNADGWWWD